MLLGVALKPHGKGIHDAAKQLLTWVFTRNRKISSTSIVNGRFKNENVENNEKSDKDDFLEKFEDIDENIDDRPRRSERFDGFNRHNRHDEESQFDNFKYRESRFDRYDRRDRFDGYDRRDRFDRYDRRDRFDRYDRRDRFDRYDRRDRFDSYGRRDGFNRYDRDEGRHYNKSSYTNISQRKDISWESEELSPFKKDFYKPQPASLNRSAEEIKQFYKTHSITVKGEDCPPPVFSFEELGLPNEILASLRAQNYTEPTPIQAQGCPIALSGKNMVGVSRTGSGKTLAFILPAVVHIKNQPPLRPDDGPIALVVAPTRELVQQIKGVSDIFRHFSHLSTAVAYGGANRSSQALLLRRGAHICIATPGRLLDFLNEGATNLKRCTYLVLDEADRMFDMGFEPQVREIMEHIRPDRQVLMWSATWPDEVRNLASDYLKEFIQINVGSTELTANPNIKQIVHVCQERDKKNLLLDILNSTRENEERKTLIFTLTKSKADEIAYWLNSRGFRTVVMHGDKSQSSRESTLNNFRSGKFLYLVATSVAARGLDVQDIRYVINYDFPMNMEDYVHRIGRTARHEASGTAHTFFTEANANRADELIHILRKSNQEINPELLEFKRFSKRKQQKSWT